jgi:hypothetical protein
MSSVRVYHVNPSLGKDALPFRVHPQALAVGNEFNRAILICEINIARTHAGSQSLHYLSAGVAEGIICSHADHCHFGGNRRQKVLRS